MAIILLTSKIHFSSASVPEREHEVSEVGYWCCDKTPCPKATWERNGLVSFIALGSHSITEGSQGRSSRLEVKQKRPWRSVLFSGVVLTACSACFLTHPGSPIQAWHQPQVSWALHGLAGLQANLRELFSQLRNSLLRGLLVYVKWTKTNQPMWWLCHAHHNAPPRHFYTLTRGKILSYLGTIIVAYILNGLYISYFHGLIG